MEFYVEQKVLDAGIKLYAGITRGVDNNGDTEEWTNYRTERTGDGRIAELVCSHQ